MLLLNRRATGRRDGVVEKRFVREVVFAAVWKDGVVWHLSMQSRVWARVRECFDAGTCKYRGAMV